MSEYVTEHLTETQIIEDRIARACVTIREAWPHMLPTGVPGKRPGGGARSVGIVQRPESEADYHDTGEHDVDAMTRIASLRREVVEELAQWCRLIIEDRPVTATKVDGSDVQQMCDFVKRHAQWLSGHRDAEEAADRLGGCRPGCEARSLVPTHSCSGLARRVAQHVRPHQIVPEDYTPPRPRPHLIGSCPMEWPAPTDDSGEEMRVCGGDVYAYPTGLLDPTRAEQVAMRLPTCDRCGTEAQVDWWYREMYRDSTLSHLVTVDELIAVIAVRLDWTVTRGQVRQWVHRGKIATEGKDSKGRTLYRHDDVCQAIEGDAEREKVKARRAS